MSRTRLIPALLLSLLAGTAVARPMTVSFSVDAQQNCLEWYYGYGTIAGFINIPLEPGTWRAEVVSSTMYENVAYPDQLNSRVALIQGYNVLAGIEIGKPVRFTVSEDTSPDMKAFIVDPICRDNGGSAMVKFTRLKAL